MILQRALAAVLVAVLLTAGAPAAPKDTVVIGVRQDARPFAWRDDDAPGTFRGYLADLCTDATTRAGFYFDLVPVTAAEREDVLDGEFDVGGKRLDLLCDPTTITLSRLDKLGDSALFSPIVFVANGSFVKHGKFENRAPCKIGATDETRSACTRGAVQGKTGEQVIAPPKLVCDPEMGGEVSAYFVGGYVVGTTAANTLDRAIGLDQIPLKVGESLCIQETTDHTEGVKRFCDNALHFYFGDLDIIQAYANLVREDGGKCDLARAERPLTYEPYALLITSERADFRARFVAAVYEIFFDNTAAGLFEAYFPDHAKSTALDMLFRINSIPSLRAAPQEGDSNR